MSRSAPIADSVTVSVPARLHLGFMDLNGGLGRRFGGIGLALKELGTTISIKPSTQTQVDGPDHARARGYLESMRRQLRLNAHYHLVVEEAVPAHAGLGSGTQLALAVAAGVRRVHDFPLDVLGDASRLGRGQRSGIGVGLFYRGGLIVDGGHAPDSTKAPIICEMAFPESWAVLVVLDPDRQGLHGADEVAAFAALPSFPEDEAGRLCRLVLMKALPSLAEQDLAGFSSAIAEIQMRLGDYYAPVQGGRRFTSPRVEAALELLKSKGALGIGQSSWGPTGFAFVSSQEKANRIAAITREHPTGQGLDIRVCSGLNRAAVISREGYRR